MKKVVTVVFCLLLCAAILDCAKKKGAEKATAGAAVATANIVDTLLSDGRFTTLSKAIETAGLVETLKGPGPFTLFAPTDSAFAKLPPGAVDGLLGDTATLKNLLLYHVVQGRLMAADIMKMGTLGSMAGDSIAVMIMPDGKIMLGDNANVVQTDWLAKNGVIQVIDNILKPPAKTEQPAKMKM